MKLNLLQPLFAPATAEGLSTLSIRPSLVLPVGNRFDSPGSRRDTTAYRALPHDARRARPRHFDDRPEALNGLRLLPFCPHRRTDPVQSRPVRAASEGVPERGSRHGSRRARHVPLHSGAIRPRSRRPRGASRTEWPRVSEACGTNIEDLGFDRGHRTLRIVGKGNKPAVIPLVPRTARTIDLAVGERSEGAILRRRDGARLDRRTAHRWVRSIGKRAGLGAVHPHMLRAGFIMAALDAGVPLRDVQIAARHADPRTTTVYDRHRENFDRHAPYVVVAFVAGG